MEFFTRAYGLFIEYSATRNYESDDDDDDNHTEEIKLLCQQN